MREIIFLIVTSYCLFVVAAAAKSSCEEITVDQCKGIGYNHTSVSSHEDQSGQYGLAVFMMNIHPLVRSRCSPKLNFFLCTAYLPMCVEGLPPIGPCREFCQHVQHDCEPVLKLMGYHWPGDLDCTLFQHESDSKNLCIVSNMFGLILRVAREFGITITGDNKARGQSSNEESRAGRSVALSSTLLGHFSPFPSATATVLRHTCGPFFVVGAPPASGVGSSQAHVHIVSSRASERVFAVHDPLSAPARKHSRLQ
ncbi:unnamed protein product [Chilo suppressalis]|uniref:FZ domain-containing protein n=1 Tax=Chilo suppressalis TaxID=168631 RepID=A0ABN8B0X0_CHISP|nr:unnamed protein product [Chilo suppressalis]